eukprot:m.26753 g.26753  ORF g.26753 m.26753 type:complete len:492 (+) comp9294_c0_seq2:468-1943(+)
MREISERTWLIGSWEEEYVSARQSIQIEGRIRRRKVGTTFAETLLNFLKGNVGAGFLSLPFAFSMAGYIVGPAAMVVIAGIVVHCMLVLVKTKQYLSAMFHIDHISYGDMSALAFGRVGMYLTNIALLVTQFGYICVYVVFIARHLQELSPIFSFRIYALFVIPFAVCLGFIESFKRIAPASMLANTLLLFCSSVVIEYIFEHIGQTVPASPGCTFEPGIPAIPSSATSIPGTCMRAPEPVPYTSISAIPIFFGNCVYAFEAMGLVLPMENSIKDPTRFRFVVGLGMAIVVFLYLLLASSGYVVFGAALEGPVSLYLPNDNKLYVAVKALLCVTLLQSVAMQFFPARQMIEKVTDIWLEKHVSSQWRSFLHYFQRGLIMALIGSSHMCFLKYVLFNVLNFLKNIQNRGTCIADSKIGVYYQLDRVSWEHVFGNGSSSPFILLDCERSFTLGAHRQLCHRCNRYCWDGSGCIVFSERPHYWRKGIIIYHVNN